LQEAFETENGKAGRVACVLGFLWSVLPWQSPRPFVHSILMLVRTPYASERTPYLPGEPLADTPPRDWHIQRDALLSDTRILVRTAGGGGCIYTHF
jgi:hypothetical protein